MPIFSYHARNEAGELIEGYVDAPDENGAADTLQDSGLTVISLSEVRQPFWHRSLTLWERVKARDLVVFFRQLSVLISANVPIVRSLRLLEPQVSSVVLRRILAELADDVDGGAKLSQGMSRYPRVFSLLHCSLVQTGETSGKLDEVLNYLATQEERTYDLTSKVRGALIYPAIVLSLMVVISGIMVVFVIPKLTVLLTESGVPPPLPTRLLIIVADVAVRWWYVVFAALVAAAVALQLFVRTPYGRWEWDALKLRLPLVGTLFQRVYLVRFCRSLQTLLVGGVSVTRALAIVGDVVGNVVYQQVVAATIREVEDGKSITTVLARSPYVPAMVPQMMAIGEQTGKLDEILEKISTFYSREVDNLTANLTAVIGPVMIIVIALGVLALFAAVLLPIYNLIGA